VPIGSGQQEIDHLAGLGNISISVEAGVEKGAIAHTRPVESACSTSRSAPARMCFFRPP
jgi:hypothetical protein